MGMPDTRSLIALGSRLVTAVERIADLCDRMEEENTSTAKLDEITGLYDDWYNSGPSHPVDTRDTLHKIGGVLYGRMDEGS